MTYEEFLETYPDYVERVKNESYEAGSTMMARVIFDCIQDFVERPEYQTGSDPMVHTILDTIKCFAVDGGEK